MRRVAPTTRSPLAYPRIMSELTIGVLVLVAFMSATGLGMAVTLRRIAREEHGSGPRIDSGRRSAEPSYAAGDRGMEGPVEHGADARTERSAGPGGARVLRALAPFIVAEGIFVILFVVWYVTNV